MSTSKITLIGFYNYFKSMDDNLFKNMVLPDGIDKDTLINSILLRGGEFEILYANPQFMQSVIGPWSQKHQKTFEKWIKAVNTEYDPIENYDRKEEWKDIGTGKSNADSLSKVSAFNSNQMQNDSSNTGTSDFNNENIRTGRAHGNIGVTTSQQMLEAEFEVAKWNIYEHITDIFLEEFIIPIY